MGLWGESFFLKISSVESACSAIKSAGVAGVEVCVGVPPLCTLDHSQVTFDDRITLVSRSRLRLIVVVIMPPAVASVADIASSTSAGELKEKPETLVTRKRL